MIRIISLIFVVLIGTHTVANAMSAGERMYLKKTRQSAPVTRYAAKTVAVEQVDTRPSSANYEAGIKYYGSLSGQARDAMMKRRTAQLEKAEGGHARIDFCLNKYWDSLRSASCLGEPR